MHWKVPIQYVLLLASESFDRWFEASSNCEDASKTVAAVHRMEAGFHKEWEAKDLTSTNTPCDGYVGVILNITRWSALLLLLRLSG